MKNENEYQFKMFVCCKVCFMHQPKVSFIVGAHPTSQSQSYCWLTPPVKVSFIVGAHPTSQS